jgi:aspartate kinase
MPGTVVGVASERDVIVLQADAKPSDVLALLDDRGVAGKQLHVFDNRTDMVLSRENLHDESRLRAALDSQFGSRARLIDGLAAVSVVGAGINASNANMRAGSALLEENGIAPAMIATSSFRITWMVPRDRTNEAVQLLHYRFIESAQPLVP